MAQITYLKPEDLTVEDIKSLPEGFKVYRSTYNGLALVGKNRTSLWQLNRKMDGSLNLGGGSLRNPGKGTKYQKSKAIEI